MRVIGVDDSVLFRAAISDAVSSIETVKHVEMVQNSMGKGRLLWTRDISE